MFLVKYAFEQFRKNIDGLAQGFCVGIVMAALIVKEIYFSIFSFDIDCPSKNFRQHPTRGSKNSKIGGRLEILSFCSYSLY